MYVQNKKTDNANLSKKIELRRKATKHLKNLYVLDLFAGNNTLWSHFNTDKYYGVEKVKGKGNNLTADNLKVIANLNLGKFNVIDVDSYGIPFNQLYEVFNNPTLQKGTTIVYTCITNGMSGANRKCVDFFNFKNIHKKAKTLVTKKLHELFWGYLYANGVRIIYMYCEQPGKTSFYKEYGYFIY